MRLDCGDNCVLVKPHVVNLIKSPTNNTESMATIVDVPCPKCKAHLAKLIERGLPKKDDEGRPIPGKHIDIYQCKECNHKFEKPCYDVISP